MLQSDIQKAQSLSRQLSSLGYGKKTVIKKKEVKKSKGLYSFAFPYEALKPKEDNSAVLIRQAVNVAQESAKSAAELSKIASDLSSRLSKSESISHSAIQIASTANKNIENIGKSVSEELAFTIKNTIDTVDSMKVEHAKSLEEIKQTIASIKEVKPEETETEEPEETEEPFEITQDMVRTIVQMMHKLPEVDKLEVSKGVRNANSFIYGKTKYKSEEMMHGGGDTVSAGNGITITNVNGVKVLSAPAGATTYTQSGVIADLNSLTALHNINTVFTFAINGMFYHITTDYTVAGAVITYTTPLDVSLTGKPYTLIYA